jgi:hypothetical protein
MYFSIKDVQQQELLDNQRESTMLSPEFQKWKQEFNVSRSYVDPSGQYRAKELNSQYDYSSSRPASSFLNFLKIKGIW